jgi:dihydroorotate dehydrogenase (fumarate)
MPDQREPSSPETLQRVLTEGVPLGRWKEGLLFEGINPTPGLASAANWFPRTEEVEQRHLDVLAAVKSAATVPVAVKLSPYFSATADMAHRLDAAGADGLVLFNRFLQPDIDPETLTTVRAVTLSTSAETRLPLTWIALLRGRVRASLAASTGVEQPADVAKYLLAKADVVQSTSALLRHGPEYAGVLLQGLCNWMNRKGYQTLDEVRGLLAAPDAEGWAARERADYVWAVREANSGAYDTY